MNFKSKKIISIVALIALILTSIALFASCGASTPADNGGTEGNITWKYVSDTKKLEIIGNPAEPVEMNNYSLETRAPWYDYRSYIAEIEITGVAKIGEYAFHSLYYVKEIDLGSSLKEIGKFAFAFCGGSVTTTDETAVALTIPEGVTAIGESAFECCSILGSVSLPQTVESIGDRAFAYNPNLSKVSLPEAFKTANEDSLSSIFKKSVDENDEPVIPTIEAVAPPAPEAEEKPAEGEAAESGEASDKPSEDVTDAPAEEPTEAPTEEPTESESETEAETEAAPQNKTTTIIAIVVLALVIIGIIVGAVLLMRSNKKMTNDSRTVRKNDNAKGSKKSSKGKKK